MGYPYEVSAYVAQSKYEYDYAVIYCGRSLLAAVRAMLAARRGGCKCVRFVWRG